MEPRLAKATVFPRGPLLGLMAIVAMSVVAATVGSVTHSGVPVEHGTIVAERDLLFADRADGAVVITASDHRPVEILEGQNGFVRGTLRGFARTRRADQVGKDVPFRLAKWSDGRLTLDDPATGRHVELLAFGSTNAGAFARMLTDGGPSS